MTIISSLRFLYIFGRSGLPCAVAVVAVAAAAAAAVQCARRLEGGSHVLYVLCSVILTTPRSLAIALP